MIKALPDLGLLPGEPVEILRPVRARDAHGDETVEWVADGAPSCLVKPSSTSDEIETDRPHGVKETVRVSFPKTYSKPLRGCRVRIGGRVYAIRGDPTRYRPDLVPGPYDRAAEAVRCDG